ncbi:MAG: KEOPS complex N(6)-L-threonylcarbamoyladenine synthase Kae1 [archaeon]
MVCLGIESTAHTFGIGIIDNSGKIYANCKKQYTQKESGIKPYDASQFHFKNAISILQEALEKANLKMKDINLISFAQGPGLSPCLSVGATFARILSIKYNKPLVGVNHCVAHIEIGKTLLGAKDPLVIYTSGANTQIIGKDEGIYKIIGETLDIGLGNLFDDFARSLGYGFPGGPILDKLYFEGKNYIELPYTVKGMDLFFSGLLTNAKKQIGKVDNNDLIYSFMHTAYSMLLEVSERALAYTQKKEIMVIGGVAASRVLKEMLEKFSKQLDVKLYIPPFEVCLDNGVMIADLGIKNYLEKGSQKLEDTIINPNFRTDQVKMK